MYADGTAALRYESASQPRNVYDTQRCLRHNIRLELAWWMPNVESTYRYFLKLPAATSTAAPSRTALGSRISNGLTLIGNVR